MEKYEELWSEILERFGEKNMQQLIRLLQELDGCASGIASEDK